MYADTWSVVKQLSLVVKSPVELMGKMLVYGCSDPFYLHNPAELMLTDLLAEQLGASRWFFIYKHGKNLIKYYRSHGIDLLSVLCKNYGIERKWLQNYDDSYPSPPGMRSLESIIDEALPKEFRIRDLAREIWELTRNGSRKRAVKVCYLSDGRTIRATNKKEELEKIPDISIEKMHQDGGYLAGAAIHFVLRKYAEQSSNVLYLCPFQEKGLVYELYKGINRQLFLLAPFVRISPPPELVIKGWEPIVFPVWRKALTKGERKAIRRYVKTYIEKFVQKFYNKKNENHIPEELLRIELLPRKWWAKS